MVLELLVWRPLRAAVGLAYPAYVAYKAAHARDDETLQRTRRYFTVAAAFFTVETLADIVLFWAPLYAEVKVVVVVVLVANNFGLSDQVYRRLLQPLLTAYEPLLDRTVAEAAALAPAFLRSALQRVVDRLMQQAPATAADAATLAAAPATLAAASPITIAPLGAAPAPPASVAQPEPVAEPTPVPAPVSPAVPAPAAAAVPVEDVTAAAALLTSAMRADGFVEVLGGDGSGLRQRVGAAAGRVHDSHIAETMVVGNDRPSSPAAASSGTSAEARGAAPTASALGSLSPWAAWTWLTTPTVAPATAAPPTAAAPPASATTTARP